MIREAKQLLIDEINSKKESINIKKNLIINEIDKEIENNPFKFFVDFSLLHNTKFNDYSYINEIKNDFKKHVITKFKQYNLPQVYMENNNSNFEIIRMIYCFDLKGYIESCEYIDKHNKLKVKVTASIFITDYNKKIEIPILHANQTRKTGEPYIVHPARVTSELLALGLDQDIFLATALLHDVLEDCNISAVELGDKYQLSKEIIDYISILTKHTGIDTKNYYDEILKYPVTTLVKISDRCNNVSTMVGGFSKEKIKEYVDETENYVLPLCKQGKNFYSEYSNQIFVMKYHIESICKIAKNSI